jgi:hypothetical protein
MEEEPLDGCMHTRYGTDDVSGSNSKGNCNGIVLRTIYEL